MKKTFQYVNAVALVFTIVINYLSNTGVFNGETMATISAKYQNLFTPAGYAFSIWGLIYIGLLGFVIYYGPFTKASETKEKIVQNIGWWFVVSCVGNSLWVVAWLYEYTLLTIPIMVIVFISLLKIILNTQPQIVSSDFRTKLFLRLPFYIYSGWISVALIADIAAYLKKIEWAGFGISETSWAIMMFAIATGVHLFMIWKRNMPAFAMVALWAFIAIAVANQPNNSAVFYAAIGFAIFVFINVLAHSLKRVTTK